VGLGKYAHISVWTSSQSALAGTLFFQFRGEITLVPGHNNVPSNDTSLFCHTDGSSLHISICEG